MENTLTKREKILIAIIVVLGISLLVCISELMSRSTETELPDSTSTNTTADTTPVSDAATESESIAEEEKGDLIEISIDDYLNIKQGENAAIIYIARPTCHYCSIQEPIARHLVYKYGVPINYLNTDNLDADGQNALIQSDEMFGSGISTPTTIIVQGNKIIDSAIGVQSIDELTEFFKKNGFIN